MYTYITMYIWLNYVYPTIASIGMNEELVSVEGLVLEKMMVLDEFDDAMVLKNTCYDVDEVEDRGDAGDRGATVDAGDRGDRVQKQLGGKSGNSMKRFSYRELMTQRGAGRWTDRQTVDDDLMLEILLESIIIITIIITHLLLIIIIIIYHHHLH